MSQRDPSTHGPAIEAAGMVGSLDVLSALTLDEVRRIAGDVWAERMGDIERYPAVPHDTPARHAIREFFAEEVKAFDERGYAPHPTYTGGYKLGSSEVSKTPITTRTFTSAVDEAKRVVQNGSTVAIWTSDVSENGHRVAAVYDLGGGDTTVQRIGVLEVMDDGPSLEEIAENPTKSLQNVTWFDDEVDEDSSDPTPDSEWVPETPWAEVGSPDDLTDADVEAIKEVMYDEVERVMGTYWLENRIKPLEKGSSIPIHTSYQTITSHNDDPEFWPPTESNLRGFARDSMAVTIRQFDDQMQPPHPDYDGEYDPSGHLEQEGAKLVEEICTGEMAVTVGEATAIWTGEVNIRDEDGTMVGRKSGCVEPTGGADNPDGNSAIINVYAPLQKGSAPELVRSTGAEATSRQELRDVLEGMAERANEQYPR